MFSNSLKFRYEFCKANKWHRPGFSVPHVPGTTAGDTACTCKITLRRDDPKSKEAMSIHVHDKSRCVTRVGIIWFFEAAPCFALG